MRKERLAETRIAWLGELSDADLELGQSLLPAGYILGRVRLESDTILESDLPWLRASHAIVVRRERVDQRLLSLSPDVALIQVYGTRDDLIDRRAAAAAGIQVTTTHLRGCVAVAELALALMLCLSKRVVEGHLSVVNGAYHALGLTPFATNQSRHAFQWMQLPDLFELSGRTVGIVGFGEIGSEVAIRANAFGMRVLYTKRRRLAVMAESELSVEWYDLDFLLANSDFVVLSLPYSPAVHHLVGERQLALMKPTSYLVNVARGPLVDERALARALSQGQIAGAGLDVFELEPWVRRDELATHRRTVLTPHIGGGSGGAREKQLSDVLNGVVQYMSTRSASVRKEE